MGVQNHTSHCFAFAHQSWALWKYLHQSSVSLVFWPTSSIVHMEAKFTRIYFRFDCNFSKFKYQFDYKNKRKAICTFVHYKIILWYFWTFNLEPKIKTKPSNIELQNISNFQDWFPLELLKDLSFPNAFKDVPTRIIGWPWYWQDLPISN